MSYGGYDQGYGGNQVYVGGFGCNMQDYSYQQQQTMPYQAHGGYNPYGQLDVYPPQQMSGVTGNASGAYQYHGCTQPCGDDAHSTALKSSKSFTGPPADVERKQSTVSRTRSVASRSKGGGTGMARHGSVFFGARERDTQVAISTRGGMSVRGLDEEESEELKQYYGDMACRNEERRMDGLKAVRSYRGDIEDGEDVGKPRRVTNRRNIDGRSATGYGGINFKRKAAMRNGEQWGEVEIRNRSNGNGGRSRSMERPVVQQPMPGPSMYMSPAVFEEPAVVPQIYNREDVHSYSNISDSFSEADEGAPRDFDY
ncbi:conserved hypothetical protein [Leishmania major strain Friedlin]|uniref:Uncharacterized protein n=1 Tax=Leishmania major TaxID=5664 RepID=Q4Q3P3_LEIMA|nr:conserved hypothetical protein [Leishmania major strain Friedlin]CAG9580981.1 hypothetical_protein_-_conserved [Leishmania major strain Friedlin]CAJ06814.1 conserved hypothetical protein [Leishmania major strain Friedlin]|eukprot:XP_001686055.1 conserved hypothetical protein [Leishmania major strain Friedlin]